MSSADFFIKSIDIPFVGFIVSEARGRNRTEVPGMDEFDLERLRQSAKTAAVVLAQMQTSANSNPRDFNVAPIRECAAILRPLLKNQGDLFNRLATSDADALHQAAQRVNPKFKPCQTRNFVAEIVGTTLNIEHMSEPAKIERAHTFFSHLAQ